MPTAPVAGWTSAWAACDGPPAGSVLWVRGSQEHGLVRLEVGLGPCHGGEEEGVVAVFWLTRGPPLFFSSSSGPAFRLQEGPGQMFSMARAATPVLGPSGLGCVLQMDFTTGPEGMGAAFVPLAQPNAAQH